MSDCELLTACPFFNDMTQDANELIELYKALYKETYCHGCYEWCGRYMAFKALGREPQVERNPALMVDGGNGDGQR